MHQFWQVNTVYSKNTENQREWETISSLLVCILICYRLHSKHESKWKLPSTLSQSFCCCFCCFCFYIILPTLSSNLARTHFNRSGSMCANVACMVQTFVFISVLKPIFYIDSLVWQKMRDNLLIGEEKTGSNINIVSTKRCWELRISNEKMANKRLYP